ncbi:type 3 secretion system effector OspC1, partial [Shigella sonnei]|nr:type 3 secretion system effector OspC1 [Shigella sonnei]EFW9534681.1 hypothetical protein [Shigella sonnei]EFX9403681.1 hypothetical protein [Shigella sonnei]
MNISETLNSANTQCNIDSMDNRLHTLFPKVTSVRNAAQQTMPDEKNLKDSANIIKDFFRKTIAAQSYSRMFSQGSNFKSLNIAIDAPSDAKASFKAIEHLDRLSKHYISEIREKLHPLSAEELNLLSLIINSDLIFRHQSNSDLSDKILNIKSFNKIQSEGICTKRNTYADDIKKIANHDFVFFGVEISSHQKKHPLNTKHHTVDFGANAYIIDHDSPYGYM